MVIKTAEELKAQLQRRGLLIEHPDGTFSSAIPVTIVIKNGRESRRMQDVVLNARDSRILMTVDALLGTTCSISLDEAERFDIYFPDVPRQAKPVR